MAMNELPPFAPKPRVLTGDDLERMRFDYDPTSDTLTIYLGGTPQAAISVVKDDYLSYRVDPESEEIVGYQIEDFLTEAIQHVPSYLAIADLLDIAPQAMRPVGQAISAEQRRRVAAETVAGHLMPLGV